MRSAKVVKANDSEEGESVGFTVESMTIHSDGTTAPIVVPVEGERPGPRATTTKRKLSANAKVGLDALTETLINYGTPAAKHLELPLGTSTVTLEQWEDELLRRSVLDQKDSNRWRGFKRIRDQLAAKSIIGIRDNYVWTTSS